MKIVKLFGKYSIKGLTLEHLHLLEALTGQVSNEGEYGTAAYEVYRAIDTHPDTESILRVSSKHKYLEEVTHDPVIMVN